MQTDIIRGSIWQKDDVALIARVRDVTGAYITQASISAISYQVFDLSSATPTIATSSGSILVTTIFNTIQPAGVLWDVDNIGYNWLYTIAGTNFPNGPNDYRVEVTFTPVSGNKFRVVFEPKTRPLLTTPL